MKLGLYVRNMGPQSTRPLLADAARAAEEAGIDDLWVADHLALAPEDAEGSDGIASLREGMAAAGKPVPEDVLLQPLPVDDDERLACRLRELAALGVTRVVHPWRYRDAEEVARVAARLVAARDAHAPSV